MLASVGPYKFMRSAFRSPSLLSSLKSVQCSGFNASPLANTYLNDVRSVPLRSAWTCSRNRFSIVGTKWIVVTPCFSIALHISLASFSSPGLSRTTFAPARAHHTISHTDTSKVNVVFCIITSFSVIGYLPCIQLSLLIRPV